jgi:hypothetical protein
MFAGEYMPVYDVSDSVATVVDASAATTWDALMNVDLMEVGRQRPVVGLLGAIRGLPDLIVQLLRGKPLPALPKTLKLRDLAGLPQDQGGWILLGVREQHEIALGLIGKFWLPVIEFATVPTPPAFRDFADPGFAKTVYALTLQSINDHRTLLSATMRTATTDEHARQWFRRYWTLGVGSGAHILVNGLLDVTRELAERKVAA